MLSVHVISEENKDLAFQYLKQKQIQYDLLGHIAMLCTDGAEPAGFVSACLCGETEISSELDWIIAEDNEIVYLLVRSIFHILERRGIFDVFCKKEEYFPFLQQHGMKETIKDGKKMLVLNLQGYFEAGHETKHE